MPKEWTGELVGLMHNHRITYQRLAKEMGLTNRYVSMVLNGHREPPGIEQRFREAVSQIISEEVNDHAEITEATAAASGGSSGIHKA